MGFIAGRATSCNFFCEDKELFVTVHGAGSKGSPELLKSVLESAWEIKAEFLRPQAARCSQEIRVLNRTLRWAGQGFEYEPDQRHAGLVIEHAGVSHCKPLSIPCCSDADYDESKRPK